MKPRPRVSALPIAVLSITATLLVPMGPGSTVSSSEPVANVTASAFAPGLSITSPDGLVPADEQSGELFGRDEPSTATR